MMMDRTRVTISAALLLACVLAPTNVYAVLVESSDPSSPGGTNNITLDTDTGLEWLDWTASTSLTFNEITGQMGSGGNFDTWRHATAEEVKTLFSSFALPVPVSDFVSNAFVATGDNGSSYNAAASLLGITNPVDKTSAIIGQSSGGTNTNLVASGSHLRVELGTIGSEVSGTYTIAYSVDDDTQLATFGHALVRVGSTISSVPEPSAFLCVGLIGLSVGFRRKRIR